jgi:hypothetical protein
MQLTEQVCNRMPVDKCAGNDHIHAHDQTGDTPPTEALAAF